MKSDVVYFGMTLLWFSLMGLFGIFLPWIDLVCPTAIIFIACIDLFFCIFIIYLGYIEEDFKEKEK